MKRNERLNELYKLMYSKEFEIEVIKREINILEKSKSKEKWKKVRKKRRDS